MIVLGGGGPNVAVRKSLPLAKKYHPKTAQEFSEDVMPFTQKLKGVCKNSLGPAKTYILRGTPWTYAIETRAVTDN